MSRNADNTSGGKTTVDRATATLLEDDLYPTSTMLTPSPCGVRCENGDAGAEEDGEAGALLGCNVGDVSISAAVLPTLCAAFLN